VRYEAYGQSPLGAPLPGLHHHLDKVKFPILAIGPQHGCLFWYLATVQQSSMIYTENSSTLSSRSYLCFVIFFFNHHSLFNIGFLFIIRCWTFDVRCSFFSFRPGQKQLCAYALSSPHGALQYSIDIFGDIDGLEILGVGDIKADPVLVSLHHQCVVG